MRVLYARHGHVRLRPAGGEPESDRRRSARGHRGQPLPLHRLPEHRPGRAVRRCDHGGQVMTATAERPAAEIGQARKRKEDAHLLTGRTTWTDNMTLPGMLHLAILRSPTSHARITGVDLSGALASPGVVAAYSGQDFKDVQGT